MPGQLPPSFFLASPFKGSGRRRRLRGPLRQLLPSVGIPLAASDLRGSKFPAGENKVDPSPYPPPKGGGFCNLGAAALFFLGSPFKGSCRRRRLRGPTRQLPPSVEQAPPNSAPSQFQQPKGGGRLVFPHAALSPELGSKLKARSGCKSGTTAPGVQGAGRGPRRPPPYPPPEGEAGRGRCPRKKVTRLSGRDPTTPPAGCRKIPNERNFSVPSPSAAAGNRLARAPSGPCGATSPSGRPFPA